MLAHCLQLHAPEAQQITGLNLSSFKNTVQGEVAT